MEDSAEASAQPAILTAAVAAAAPSTAPLRISHSLRCHVGVVRTENQDRAGHASSLSGELLVVADGVGGGAGGAEAATLAVAEFEALRLEPGEEPAQALQRVTRAVNQRIDALRQADPTLVGMASTLAVVLVQGRTLFVGHLGDSRVYRARAGSLQLLTRDHSVVRRMVDDGIISEEQAQTHPSGHILTHSLGQEDVELEVSILTFEPADTLLLCSDGLWAYVPEPSLAQALASTPLDPEAAADSLLALALAAGAPDNVSIALLHAASSPAQPGTASPTLQGSTRSRKRLLLLALLAGILTALAVWLIIWFAGR